MIEYALAILATYYLSTMAALEDGPFGLCARIREWIDPEQKQDTWLRRGVNCPICISAYVALLATLLLQVTSWQIFILSWFGVAGASRALYLWVDR